eukprot:TRINITY_DN18454_c0_g1_i2.p1 TRINITY_DN18454_c0_g1~~TRINITY_DN18454_c0_g1_i2.p1  ORF type:complete len:860 (-),score=136.46 TRINITY_DN18454_c0_g1_i2:248-2827(-)
MCIRDRHWTHAFDKFGRPVMVEKASLAEIDKALEHTTHEALVRYHVWRAEKNAGKLHAQTKRTGYQVDTLVSIVDVNNMGLGQVTRKFLKLVQEIAVIDQDHYPERLGQLFIINTPGLFGFVWSGVKPWLGARTLEKINILTASQVPEALQQFIEADQLPEEYGGTCHCEGGCLPEEHNPDHEVELELELGRTPSVPEHRRTESMDSNATFHDAFSQMVESQADEEFSDEELTPEEAEELEATRQKLAQTLTQFKYWNGVPYGVGVMLLTLGAYARAQLWYDHGVEWTAWCVAMSMLLGMTIFIVGLAGNYGMQASSPQVLTWYSRLLFFFAVQVLIVGIALVALHNQFADMLVEQTGTAYDPARMENFSIAFGTLSLCAGLLLLIPCFVASNLKARIESQPDPIDDFAMVRPLVRILAATTLALALASVGLGYACSLLAMYCSQFVFGMFIFTAGSVLIALQSVFAIILSSASKNSNTMKIVKFGRIGALLTCLGLVALIISTGASFPEIESDVQNNWSTIQAELSDSPWSSASQMEIVSTLRWNRIFVTGCSIVMLTLVAVCGVVLGTFQAYIDSNLRDEVDTVDELPPLSCKEKTVVIWACTAAAFQLFWEGQYLMFNYWVSDKGGARNETTESWFVSSWLLMGEVDSRFKDQDDTLYIIELFTVAIAMPLALFFAWTTYSQRPSRFIVGVMACFLQIYHAMLYFGTEAASNFSHTADSDTAKFWLIFVLVTFLRFVIPIPIFVSSWKYLVKAVSFHDQSMLRRGRALPLEVELKTTGFEGATVEAEPQCDHLPQKEEFLSGSEGMFSPLGASHESDVGVDTPLSFQDGCQGEADMPSLDLSDMSTPPNSVQRPQV